MAKLLKYPELQLVEQRIENPRVGGSSPPPGTISKFQGSSFTVQVSEFLKLTFRNDRDCRQGCIQGHRTICGAEMAFSTSHAMYHRI